MGLAGTHAIAVDPEPHTTHRGCGDASLIHRPARPGATQIEITNPSLGWIYLCNHSGRLDCIIP